MNLTRLISFIHSSVFFGRIFHTLEYCLKEELKDCDTVLDLGCGPSSPIVRVKKFKHSVGIDGYLPYVELAKMSNTHDEVIHAEFYQVEYEEKSFDAVVIIDVLEHLKKEDAISLMAKAKSWAKKKVVLSTPNGFIEQPSIDSNTLQTHLSGWGVEELKKLGFARIHGLAGVRCLRKPKGIEDTMDDNLLVSIKYQPKLFWFGLATISQLFTYFFPSSAFELFCVFRR